jgi:hypothetical protein
MAPEIPTAINGFQPKPEECGHTAIREYFLNTQVMGGGGFIPSMQHYYSMVIFTT